MDDRFNIKGEVHARKVVDEFLAAEKVPIGSAGWSCDVDTEECRIQWPLAVDGVPTRATLAVTSYPLDHEHGFTITLNFPPCVARLDFVGPTDAHTNPVEEFSRCDPIVYGPHVHLWEDNRRFCSAATLPKELSCAVALPPSVRRYEQAMFWFCSQVNIVMDHGRLLPLPPRGRLL